ncbi:MAG: mandelate racemase/muconate lactonizing enzyme family protein [Deltaproteobacteria bacterium]|nr:mandelate racemase/muconate lactonizing enzyme family protein [Deltaproteobacteria bacterium]
MKIVSVEVFELKPVSFGVVCVRINTDEGISGYGEVGLSSGKVHRSAIAIALDFGECILGMDPMRIEAIWDKIYRSTYWGIAGGSIVSAGLSAIDIALWDIKGKALGVPCYELLGGKVNAGTHAYASHVHLGWDLETKALTHPAEYAETAQAVLADGYRAMKLNPVDVNPKGVRTILNNNDPDWKLRGNLSMETLKLAYDRVAAIRKSVGEDVAIAFDLSCYTDTNTAIQLANHTKDLNIFFIEEPVHTLSPEPMIEIHTRTDIPLAAGERIFMRWGFRPFLESNAIQVAQPDVDRAGGITETKKICDMAAMYDIPVQIHAFGGPIAIAAAFQVEAALTNLLIHEVHSNAIKREMRQLGKYEYLPKNGYIEFPDLPGIGQELSEKAIREATRYVVALKG